MCSMCSSCILLFGFFYIIAINLYMLLSSSFLEPEYALDVPGWISPSAFNVIIYGIPNLIFT